MTQAAPVIFKIPAKSPQPGRGKSALPAARAKAGRLHARVEWRPDGSRPRATSVEVSFYGGVAHKD